MAGSRVHRIGSIYERMSGLLESGAFKANEKPLWYDVYEQHPPKYNPRFDRPAPDIDVKDIIYEEDIIRAKIHKLVTVKYFDLSSKRQMSQTKILIKICQEIMKTKGISVDEALKIMDIQGKIKKEETQITKTVPLTEIKP